jgi:hypothetical protein
MPALDLAQGDSASGDLAQRRCQWQSQSRWHVAEWQAAAATVALTTCGQAKLVGSPACRLGAGRAPTCSGPTRSARSLLQLHSGWHWPRNWRAPSRVNGSATGDKAACSGVQLPQSCCCCTVTMRLCNPSSESEALASAVPVAKGPIDENCRATSIESSLVYIRARRLQEER